MSETATSFPVHPACKFWKIQPGRISTGNGAGGFSLKNLRVWAANPAVLEHRLTIVAETCDAVLEAAMASEPLYFGHVNYTDEFNLLCPTGHRVIDRLRARTYFVDPNTGKALGYVLASTGDIVIHPVGVAHWPGYMERYEEYQPPPDFARMRVLALVHCGKGPVSYNETRQEEKLAGLDHDLPEIHPDFEGIELNLPKYEFADTALRKRVGVVPLGAWMAAKDRPEDEPVLVSRVGQTRWDLIVSAGEFRRRFDSEEKSYLFVYHGEPRAELFGTDRKSAGRAELGEADLLEIPAGCGFSLTGTASGKRAALLWLRKDPDR